MPGIPPPPRFQADDPRAHFIMTQYLQELNRIARKISFLDSNGGNRNGRKALNLDAVWLSYVSNATADTEDTVAHQLGRVPIGFWTGIPDKPAVIYRGTTTWTSTNVYLRADVATVTVSLLLF